MVAGWGWEAVAGWAAVGLVVAAAMAAAAPAVAGWAAVVMGVD